MTKILGLVVTFNPPHGFFSVLDLLFEQMDTILVIDNASDIGIRHRLEQEVKDKKASLKVTFNHENLGIAVALNQGFHWAIRHGYKYVVALDQDSQPAPGMINALLEAYTLHPHRDRIAILAPNVEDTRADIHALYLRKRRSLFFERIPCQGDILDDISIVITSGSLNNMDIYQKLGGFREDFFIDYVDTEYCLRAARHGYKIAVACKALLHHRLGDQKRKQLGILTLRPTFHSPLRWYYINRNRIVMLEMYAIKAPYWALYDVMVGSYAFLKMLLYEDQKLRKILAVMMGIFDGLFHRMGPITPSRKRWLTSE